MVRPETVKLLILYWTTYIEYRCSELRPEAYNGMDDAAQSTNNTTIRSILLEEKLTGLNFTIWYRNLRIVIRYEKNIKFVEQPTGPAFDPEMVDPDTIDKYYKTVNLEQEQAKQELFKIVKAFHACKQKEGQSVSSYLLKMKSYLDTLERLGYAMPNELGVILILNSLNKDYDQFIQNYNMHSMWKTIVELHAMLKLHKKGIPKKAKTPAPKIIPPPKRDNTAKDSVCHHCKEVGHWSRNCPSYQAELKKRKNASVASTSGIFTIELYTFPNKTYVYDTGCGTHICNTSQGLRESRKLKHEALSLYMGNEMRAAVEAIGSFDLILPSGLIIILDNYHFAPSVTRGVVLISRLVNNGYIHTFTNYGIYVSKDNMFYLNTIPRDGMYEIDMHNLYPNVSSMFNVSNKRDKHALDSSYLWHCRLSHINKKRMDKLQRDGILQPTHDESLEKCKSCISEKMACKPFPHQVERVKDPLGLIHTDVCGPFKTVSREGANYFITFTDDFSRYGYVYLMKHKHEVFETFKVFQNEVENQLGKKIKAIRSDRRGEYLSHEFVNHMKSCGILSQLTPPYTPQHNGVSKRRNQTLLDMVRSMMNLTTLPKSFWGYALESAARILNMVPTKKVERTPYEIWHGKAPKLSYLRDTQRKRWVTTSTIHSRTRFLLLEMLSSLRIASWYKKRRSHGLLESVPIPRSARIPQALDRYGFYVDVEEYELGDLNEPPNYKAALSDPEFDKWLKAMNTEMQSMKDNQVWVLLLSILLLDIRAIRILLAISAFYDYEIWKMDVKTTFLNGHLSEDIYMVQPEGFVDPQHPNKVCKLQRSIYGLKQASRSWNKRFDVEIKKIGFIQNPDEPCVYLKASGSNVVFLILYVDDILLMGNNVTLLQEVKSWLCTCFSMKDLGEAAYIIGIKIRRDRSKRLIALSQSAYLKKILKRFWMENSKKGYIPMIENPNYRKFQGAKTPSKVQRMQRVPYASAIDSTVVKAILKYLRNTKDMVLVYGSKPEAELKVSCYADAIFQTDKDDTKSQTGYVFVLNGGAVDWKSAKQSATAMSSTEAEYIAAAEASMEAVWIRKFIDGLGGVVPSNKRPMEMLCDNEPAIAMANVLKILKGSRHFQRKYHYIREVIQEREIVLKKVHTDDNVDDSFTKPMSFDKHYEHAMAIGIVHASSLM
ncbi:retrotransposon protein, putative, ty1-copia subclass [Tanacetum coccineum]